MARFGGKSLTEPVDELINLVNNWNSIHCTSSIRKEEKVNCLINLEKDARTNLCHLVMEGIKTIYSTDFDEKEQNQYLHNQLSRPSHDRGQITLPCFRLCKVLNIKNPNKIATDLCDYISQNMQNYPFEKVLPLHGRINAYLTTEYIAQIIPLILNENNSFLSKLPSNNVRVMIEYSQPNTHKAFHVGHMRNVALGDCILRLYEHCGYDTIAANYFGDEGAHVSKCIWLLQKEITENKLDLYKIENDTSINKGEWLGQKYVESVKLSMLSNYTKFPNIGAVIAKVLSKGKHEKNDKWNVVTVDYGNNHTATVVCGGIGYEIGNLVGYVPVGQRYKDTVTTKKEMKGITSEGVILSAVELGIKLERSTEEKTQKLSKKELKKLQQIEKQRILLFDEYFPNTVIKTGEKLTEIGKYKAYNECKDVVQLWEKCVSEQKNVLKLLENGNKTYVDLWNKTREWSLAEFRKIYQWLGARFDYDFFESECSEHSRDLVSEYYNKGIFVKSDGAIGIHLKEEKLGFCMLLKSNGSGLYATKDLSLAKKKFEKFSIDKSIYVTDNTQEFHFKQVFATLNRMGYKQSENCSHLSYGFVRGPKGKFKGRTGNVILFSDLVTGLRENLNKQFLNEKRASKEWSEIELSDAARAISVAVIRYGMLNHDNNKEIVFDLEKWCEMRGGNTGPYLMLQYVRIASIERKVEFPKKYMDLKLDYSVLNESDTAKQILFELSLFQGRILDITENKSVSQLCDYLYVICKLFSQWYNLKENSVKDCEDEHLKAVRLQFCAAVAKTIKVGLELLGITPLERM